jgi:hypothetical protein
MTINSTPLPPTADPSAIQLAMNLLTALSDARGTRTRIQAFADAQQAYELAKKEHDGALEAVKVETQKLSSLQSDKTALEAAKLEHSQAVTALDVASQANAARQKSLDEREKSVSDRERALTAREVSFTERVAQLKQSLAS